MKVCFMEHVKVFVLAVKTFLVRINVNAKGSLKRLSQTLNPVVPSRLFLEN